VYLIAGLAVTFVAVSSIVQAVRQGSWGPVISVAWLPAIVVAVASGRTRCQVRRDGRLGLADRRR